MSTQKETARVLVIHDEAEDYLDSMKTRFPDMDFQACVDTNSEASVKQFAPEIIFSWKGKPIPAAVHRSYIALPSVEWVHVAGAGIEHLLPFPEGLTVTNSSGICSRFMAETVMAAMLMWNFGFPSYLEQQRARLWQQNSWGSLSQKTVLIFGVGSIGSAVATLAKSFGMRVLGIKNSLAPVDDVDEMFALDDLHDVLPEADYVCIHVPLTDRTQHFFSVDEFRRMKPSAVLINTARGGVVDEAALADALINKWIAGAYLDVFETEPLPKDSTLWGLPNLVISPHVSDSVADWPDRFIEFFMSNLERWQADQQLLNTVDLNKGY